MMGVLASLTALAFHVRRNLNGEGGAPSPMGVYALDVDLGDRLNRAALADPTAWAQLTVTGTGAPVSTAHLLTDAAGTARTPSAVWWSISDENGADVVVVEGAHDDTSVILTAPAGVVLKVFAA